MIGQLERNCQIKNPCLIERMTDWSRCKSICIWFGNVGILSFLCLLKPCYVFFFYGVEHCSSRERSVLFFSPHFVWPGTLCCVLGQDILPSQCLSPPRYINGHRRIVGETWQNCRGVTCGGLASRPGEVEILPAASWYRDRDKLRQLWARLGSKLLTSSGSQSSAKL